MNSEKKLKWLYKLLDEANNLASHFIGGYSDHFLSAEEFSQALSRSIEKLKTGDIEQINTLWLWFAPTSDWDDFTRADGEELANKIFSLLSELRKTLHLYTLVEVITDYQIAVEKVMAAFKKEFGRTDLLIAYRSDKVYPQVGKLKKYDIKRYAFHGIGLAIDFTDGTSVDFDFAFLPEQRHDGFDLWRLSKFVEANPAKYKKYLDREMLEQDFNNLIARGAIVRPDVTPSTELYFFKSSLLKDENPIDKKQRPWWKFWLWRPNSNQTSS